MQTDYFKESLFYDRAMSEIAATIERLRRKRNEDADKDRYGDHYDLLITDLTYLRNKYKKQAEQFWTMHKQTEPELDDGGITNLLVAIVKSWAEDYETALCNNSQERIDYLRKEGRNLVKDSTLTRIEKMHQKFVALAHVNLFQIVEDTAEASKHRTPHGAIRYDGDWMHTRCLLCGGGMYAKRIGENRYVVRCTGCYLTEVVDIRS